MKCFEHHKLTQRIVVVAGFAAALMVPFSVCAQYDYAPREIALLPHYCKFVGIYNMNVPGGDDPAEIAKYKEILGYMYMHMHHYCRGLQQTNYAKIFARDQVERMERFKQSIGEFNYVLGYMKDDYVLLPEVLTKKGENLFRMGKPVDALASLQRAIEVKPDYWPPYAALSDYYKDNGNKAQARAWLEKGLAAAPDAKGLRQRMADLDGVKGKRKDNQETSDKAAVPSQAAQKVGS